jgi:membrane-bound hydrogenase subunit mbhJ
MNTDNDPLWVKVIKQVRAWARLNSIWAVHFNSGSCNGCDIEILATLTPRYDVERFGIKLEGSPRHARERLLRTYEQMPAPKFVLSVGSCSISGGVFQGCYNVGGSTDDVIPVDVYIPGCPPRPEAIVDGIVQLLSSLKDGTFRKAQEPQSMEQVPA